jgi:hypothetical protein
MSSMLQRPWLYALFGVAVAALAAALGDLLVEGLSNHGVFGPGHVTDGSSIDIAPETVAGVFLLAAFVWRRVRRGLREFSAAITGRMILRLLPAIFAVQIVLLFMMETAEQRIVAGHFMGGTIWLGGPVIISLTLHATICAIVAVIALASVRFLEPRALRLIRTLLAAIVFPPSAPVVVVRSARTVPVTRWMIHHEVAKRGPPAAYLSV